MMLCQMIGMVPLLVIEFGEFQSVLEEVGRRLRLDPLPELARVPGQGQG